MYLLLPRSFYFIIFFNLSKSSYTNQSSLPNIDMCSSFEKLFISLLSSFFLKFRSNILFLSSKSNWNKIKRGNNFSYLRLFVYLFVFGKSIRPEGLFHKFPVLFSIFFTRLSNDKSFSTLDIIKSIKNYVGSFLKQFNTQLSAK